MSSLNIPVLEVRPILNKDVWQAVQNGFVDFQSAKAGDLVGAEWNASIYQGSVNPGGVSHFILKDEDGSTHLAYYPDMEGPSRSTAADIGMLLPTDRFFNHAARAEILHIASWHKDEYGPDEGVSIRVYRNVILIYPYDAESRTEFIRNCPGGLNDASIGGLVQVIACTEGLSQHAKLSLMSEINAVVAEALGWFGVKTDDLAVVTRWAGKEDLLQS